MFLSLLFIALMDDVPRRWIDAAKPPLRESRESEPQRPPLSVRDAPPIPQDRPREPPSPEKVPVGREGKPGEALVLREELGSTKDMERIEQILNLLENTKGSDYTEELAEAIPRWRTNPVVQKQVRAALTRRMTRFTTRTLQLHLENHNVECRLAAVIAIGVKRDRDLVQGLIDHLEDEVTEVIAAAAQSLKQITGRDFGEDRRTWQRYWVSWMWVQSWW